MRILLDTHIVLWTLKDDERLSSAAKDMITDPNNDIFYSSASTWKVTIKHLSRPDRLMIDGDKMAEGCREMGFKMLPVNDMHVSMLKTLTYHPRNEKDEHKDPFDRMLISQAKTENMYLLTHDSKIPQYEEKCVISV